MVLMFAHAGPAFFLSSLAGRKLNALVLISASLIIDLEHIDFISGRGTGVVASIGISHGFFHSFIGSTAFGVLYGLLFFLLMMVFWKIIDIKNRRVPSHENYRNLQKGSWNFSLKCILLSSLLGAYVHVPFDWVLYYDIRLIFNTPDNVFFFLADRKLGLMWFFTHILTLALFIAGLSIHYYRRNSKLNTEYPSSGLYDMKIRRRHICAVAAVLLTPFAIASMIVLSATLFLIVIAPYWVGTIFFENVPAYVLSVTLVITTLLLYQRALKIAGWKLIE